MVQKVENSELQFILGEEVDSRAQLGIPTACDELQESPIRMLSRKPMWRKKFRSFYHGFEKVCRAQTACSIPDDQLREDLRNSISLKVNHAYQKFVERDTDQLLNFGKAISVPNEPENLSPILDISYSRYRFYILRIVLELKWTAVSFSECWLTLQGQHFAAFMNAITTSRSHPSPGGKIHHLTKHLMNYLNDLAG
uniref:Exocyst subunit Exo70 family protein n=1 Tax=Salix viminalis TaxID=40686 RepID=A0A6N2NFK3_SALVM